MDDTTRKLTAKFDGDTSGLKAAAERGERIVEDSSRKMGRKAGDGFEKGADADRGGFLRAGLKGAGAFGETLTTGLRNLQGPAVAALVAALVVAMPAVGAIAAGGLVFAFGAGLVGLGLAVTKNSPKVKAAFDRLIRPIGDQVRQMAKPFEDVWVQILAGARRTFDAFAPILERAFAALAPVTSAFAGNLFVALEQLAPVIDPIVRAFSAIAADLGPELPGIIAGIASGITSVATSVEKNPSALTDFFKGIGEAVRLALELVAALSDLNGDIEDLTGGISAVDVIMAAFVTGPLSALIFLVKGASAVVRALKKAWDSVAGIFKGPHTAKLSADPGAFYKALGGAVSSAGRWARSNWKSIITATGTPFYAVLGAAYKSAGGWVRSTFKSALSAGWDLVNKAFDAAERIGQTWAGRVFKATFSVVSVGGGLLDKVLPGRAVGGPVGAGRSYLVGERGPEVVTFGRSGFVTPNHELGAGNVDVRVFIGDQELRGMVRTEVQSNHRAIRRAVGAGALRGAPT